MKHLSAALGALLFICDHVAAGIRVPVGFEELAQGQIIWVEVSLYGDSLGLFQTKVDLETVGFLQPELLITALQKKYSGNEELSSLLHRALNAPLKRNGNLACSSTQNALGCGFIAPDDLAVIYDENYARVSLFINQAFLPPKEPEDSYYEATSDSHNALIHQQNLNFVTDRNYQSASLQGNGSLGISQNGHLNVDWNWQGQRFRSAHHQQFNLNNAVFRQDLRKRFYVQGGLMDSRDIFSNAGGNINLSQLPLNKIRGLRVGSTQAWLNQEKLIQGTPVTVFLSRDARVDAYRGNQLLASFHLKMGSQTLDTRTFPLGSYTITLQVYEDNQLVRTQSVFYSGVSNAALNSFQWFAQTGYLSEERDRDIFGHSLILQSGFRIPLTAALSLTAGASVLRGANYWEGALDWQHGFDTGPLDGVLTTRISHLQGSDGSYGDIEQLSYNDGFSIGFYRMTMHNNDCNSYGQTHGAHIGCYESTNFMFSVPIAQWSASVSYLKNSNQGRYVTRYGLPNEGSLSQGQQIYVGPSSSQSWQASLSRYFNFNDINVNTSINLFTRRDANRDDRDKGAFISLSLSWLGRGGEAPGSSSASLGMSWQTSQNSHDPLRYNAGWSYSPDDSGENELGVLFDGINVETITAAVYGRTGGQYGNGSLRMSNSWHRRDNQQTFSSSGNYTSSMVVDRNGILWGRWGGGTPSSAVTFKVNAPEEESISKVNVSVQNAGRADVSSNSGTAFTVPGYRETAFSINESTDSSAGFSSEISKGAGKRSLFMIPGKVYHRDIELTARYTWLGKITDEQNQPINGVVPLNVLSWTPLGDGNFSLETTRRLKQLYVMKDQAFWQCGMKVKTMRDVVRWVGTVQCKSIPMAKLPTEAQQQVQLMMAGERRSTIPIASH